MIRNSFLFKDFVGSRNKKCGTVPGNEENIFKIQFFVNNEIGVQRRGCSLVIWMLGRKKWENNEWYIKQKQIA